MYFVHTALYWDPIVLVLMITLTQVQNFVSDSLLAMKLMQICSCANTCCHLKNINSLTIAKITFTANSLFYENFILRKFGAIG